MQWEITPQKIAELQDIGWFISLCLWEQGKGELALLPRKEKVLCFKCSLDVYFKKNRYGLHLQSI